MPEKILKKEWSMVLDRELNALLKSDWSDYDKRKRSTTHNNYDTSSYPFIYINTILFYHGRLVYSLSHLFVKGRRH